MRKDFFLTNTESLPAAAFDVDANEQQNFFSKSINFNLSLLVFLHVKQLQRDVFRRMLAGKWELPVEDFSMLRSSQLSRHRKFTRSTSLRVSLSKSFVDENIFLFSPI